MPAFLLYASVNALLVTLAAVVTVYFGPAAAGSGIADVKAWPGKLSARTQCMHTDKARAFRLR